MRRRAYNFDGQRAVASPTKTACGLTGATTVRPWIYDIWLGSSATPADNSLEWLIQRYTASGTSTPVTPSPLDPGDPACTSTAGYNHTVEPTYTAGLILGHFAINQRASIRVQLDPDAPLVIPATANNGIGLQPINSSFTGTVDFSVMFAE